MGCKSPNCGCKRWRAPCRNTNPTRADEDICSSGFCRCCYWAKWEEEQDGGWWGQGGGGGEEGGGHRGQHGGEGGGEAAEAIKERIGDVEKRLEKIEETLARIESILKQWAVNTWPGYPYHGGDGGE